MTHCEFVSGQADVCSVRGNLAKCYQEWVNIDAPGFILSVIRDGYKIPFIVFPPPKVSPNNGSALKEREFVSEAICNLISNKCLEVLDHPPAIVNPLSVSIQSSGKKRLILDLRHVNLYIFKQKFKCEDLSVALKVMSKGYYLFKFDLKSGYHHVEIFPDHRKYLAFAWDFGDGVLKYFQFAVLPFGLSSAPFLFTKLLKPVVTSWRCKGIPMVIFLDDGLGGGANSIQAKINSLTVNADLLKFGFVINENKSLWEPVQNIIWLGTVLDTNLGFISVTEHRIAKLKSSIDSILKGGCTTVNVRTLAAVVGQIISLTPCVGDVTRIMTRSLYAVVNTKMSWNSTVELSKEAYAELMFWNQNVDCLNCRSPWLPPSIPAKFVYSDASDHACGSFIQNENKVFHQNWSPAERTKSSTWRELKTVELALISFAPSLHSMRIAWFTDNANVASIVHSGSKVPELQDLALRIFHVCVSFGISLELKWIPRSVNSEADHLSRIIDFDDYTLNDDVFHMLDFRWGPHTIDRFACSYNAKLSRFNSRFFQPGTEAVDAFLQNWHFENNWILPPVSQIARVIAHLRVCKAEGTLVIPLWKSSYFWPLLCDDGRHWNTFVHDWVVLPKFKQLFVRGKAKNGLFGARELSFIVVALRISFKLPERISLSGFCTHDSGCCPKCRLR